MEIDLKYSIKVLVNKLNEINKSTIKNSDDYLEKLPEVEKIIIKSKKESLKKSIQILTLLNE